MSVRDKASFLFDLDGTLVDSAALHEHAFRTALAAHAPHLAGGFSYARWMGWPTLAVFRSLGLPGDLCATLTHEKQHLYRGLLREGKLRAYEGAGELLEYLAREGRRLWLVTGASPQTAREVLSQTRLERFFQGTVTAADAARGKPSPDPYLVCMERYGLRASDSVAVEDSPDGVESGVRAGLDVIRVNCAAGAETPWAFPDLAALRRFLEVDFS